ncbi:ABC transporter ATP-binding protein [Jiangella mangrovi]|uniref:ABC-type multidrug transport system fused ATPase/permease subunit n=1 Tax=Jiangella mangrovi TaxID=1524084 RepID=A0A7W9GLA4_9ACTN|nr:ABC transporter ATP-binding protein [Jiangella mangrovi]MBB5785972.1 ABC-type multidrug transport system fused ATPase/permease subunit [Jiangella mangrovi]
MSGTSPAGSSAGSSAGLPVATAREVRRHARRLALRHRRELTVAVVLHSLGAATGLAGPWLIGRLVQDVSAGVDDVGRITALICFFVVAQAVLTGLAMFASARLGEKVLAQLREEFVDGVLALPLGTVEAAGTGDLITRTTRDVDLLARAVRYAVPDTFLSVVTIVLTLGGLVLLGPLLAAFALVSAPILGVATRWYLRRARDAYLRENASYSRLAEGLAETVDGARTVEALRLGDRRFARVQSDIATSYGAERFTMYLRTVYLPHVDVSFILPVVATLVFGGLLYLDGVVTLAAVTAATLYTQQLLNPVDTLLFWLNELQVGGAAMARLRGVRPSAAPASAPGESHGPQADAVVDKGFELHGVSHAYRPGHDVLHDIDLTIAAGERLAVVGPSGAGKSTLGKLLAGVHAPRTGTITVGGVPVASLSLEDLRAEVALVTQEHHVFRASLRDNVLMARPSASDASVEEALRAVDAWSWAASVGLDTAVGAGGVELSPAQAQQLALARLVLADPHTLVLDEATSLLDPRAARHLERSLAAVLTGRTVVAIAHRLHTAHDADRIAVMEAGRIVELGSHAELVAAGGAYAALWRSWHGQD